MYDKYNNASIGERAAINGGLGAGVGLAGGSIYDLIANGQIGWQNPLLAAGLGGGAGVGGTYGYDYLNQPKKPVV